MTTRWYTVMYTDGYDPNPRTAASWCGGFKHVQTTSAKEAVKTIERTTMFEVFAVFDGLIYPSWTE